MCRPGAIPPAARSFLDGAAPPAPADQRAHGKTGGEDDEVGEGNEYLGLLHPRLRRKALVFVKKAPPEAGAPVYESTEDGGEFADDEKCQHTRAARALIWINNPSDWCPSIRRLRAGVVPSPRRRPRRRC